MQSLVLPKTILSTSKQIPLHGAYVQDKNLTEVFKDQEVERVAPFIKDPLDFQSSDSTRLHMMGGENSICKTALEKYQRY